MKQEFLSLETMDRLVGHELGLSEWVRLDQAVISEFAHCTGDDQWIHVDVERSAREGPFGSTIAHGYLTLALVGPAALEVWIRPAGIGTALNYGIDRVRFLAPVPSGARVRNRVKLVAVDVKPDGRVLITTENTIEIEGQDRPALIANTLVMAAPDAPIAAEIVTPTQLTRDLAWRVGRIAFDNKTLKDAADEFSRYSDTHIQIDPAIADRTITGLFVSNDPVGFARAAALSLNLQANVSEGVIRITR